MKMVDIFGGMRLAISEEEYLIVEQIREEKKLYKKQLEERYKTLASDLVSRGVLNRHKDDEGIFYTFNGLEDIGRN